MDNKIIAEEEPPCEFELAEGRESSRLFIDLVEKDPQAIKTEFGLVPNLDLLFTLKCSHRYLKNSPFVFKTLTDYHMMKKAGAKVRPEYKEFLKLREKETYTYKTPNLSVNKEAFFDAAHGVNYEYEHDSIHLAVALQEKPAYMYYMKDGEEVKSDKEKFFKCPEQIRINGVLEECATLAIERSLVPFPGKLSPKEAWMMAFSKVITSITSGFFREWAYENAFLVLKHYPEDYYERFLKGVENGTVVRVKKD